MPEYVIKNHKIPIRNSIEKMPQNSSRKEETKCMHKVDNLHGRPIGIDLNIGLVLQIEKD